MNKPIKYELSLQALEGAQTDERWLMDVSTIIGTHMLDGGKRTPEIAKEMNIHEMVLRELICRKRIVRPQDRQKILAWISKLPIYRN